MKEENTDVNKNEEQFSDFIEAAAHDLTAPLRKLSVLIDRVFTKQAGQFDDSAKEYIHRIQSCIDEMRSLIDGLTELARAGSNTVPITSCDLNLVAKDVIKTLHEEIENKKAEIQTAQLPVLPGNLLQYKQLFTNLLENAIKFGKKNVPPKISITEDQISDEERKIVPFPDGNNYHKIEICDNGIGFNQANAEKIFEPFIRLHSKSEYEGNGLGLAICKRIVGNHRGIIYAEGNENEGSRFVLILPETALP